jgi:hypothetical protein
MLILALSSCLTEQSSTEYFEDIDLFAMKGRFKQKNPSYPYIEIKSVTQEHKIVTYFYNGHDRSVNNYIKKEGYWFSKTSMDLEQEKLIYVFEYVFNDKVVGLYYVGDPEEDEEFEFYSIEILERDKRTKFLQFKNEKVKPTADYLTILSTNKHNGEIVDYYTIDSGILKVEKKRAVNSTTECYEIRNYSIFWWRSFGPMNPKLPCN